MKRNEELRAKRYKVDYLSWGYDTCDYAWDHFSCWCLSVEFFKRFNFNDLDWNASVGRIEFISWDTFWTYTSSLSILGVKLTSFTELVIADVKSNKDCTFKISIRGVWNQRSWVRNVIASLNQGILRKDLIFEIIGPF